MLCLILSILLVITSALAINTYSRLQKSIKNYPDENVFQDNTNMSVRYVKISLITMIISITLGGILFLICCYQLLPKK
jgi:hypothetical protein